jgi:hypothetical protein
MMLLSERLRARLVASLRKSRHRRQSYSGTRFITREKKKARRRIHRKPHDKFTMRGIKVQENTAARRTLIFVCYLCPGYYETAIE